MTFIRRWFMKNSLGTNERALFIANSNATISLAAIYSIASDFTLSRHGNGIHLNAREYIYMYICWLFVIIVCFRFLYLRNLFFHKTKTKTNYQEKFHGAVVADPRWIFLRQLFFISYCCCCCCYLAFDYYCSIWVRLFMHCIYEWDFCIQCIRTRTHIVLSTFKE